MTTAERHLIDAAHVAGHRLLTAAKLHGNAEWERIAIELTQSAMDCEPGIYGPRKQDADAPGSCEHCPASGGGCALCSPVGVGELV